jgi:hypothetical protein
LEFPEEVKGDLLVEFRESKRKAYLGYLDEIIELGMRKFRYKNTKNPEKIRWGRLVGQLVACGAGLLKDIEDEEYDERLKAVEEALRRDGRL